MKNDGPTATTKLTCFDCKHCESEGYQVQGDSGRDVYCTHAENGTPGERRRVDDSNWKTPDWCPLREQAIRNHMCELQLAVGSTRSERPETPAAHVATLVDRIDTLEAHMRVIVKNFPAVGSARGERSPKDNQAKDQ